MMQAFRLKRSSCFILKSAPVFLLLHLLISAKATKETDEIHQMKESNSMIIEEGENVNELLKHEGIVCGAEDSDGDKTLISSIKHHTCSLPSNNDSVKPLKAFLLGATGQVGKELLHQLLSNNSISKVTVIGRRKLTVKLPDELGKKLEERIVDFERLEEFANAFEGFDVGFCCLGTTRAKSGAEGFVRVDHDYVLESATLAKRAGCKDFHLVTSQGSNKDSWFLYPQTKGLVEEKVSQLGFNRLSIYRPGLLLCEREERRPLEKALQIIIGALDRWEVLSIPTKSVAQAMLNNAFKSLKTSQPSVEILTHSEIVELSKLY